MPRALLALLALALPLAAAPVPKAVKGKAPAVVGTTWVGEQDAEHMSPTEFTFHDDGKMTYHYPKRQQTFTDGFWEQDGSTVTFHVNNRFAWATLSYTDGRYEGTVTNKNGVTWKITMRSQDK